MKYIKKFIINEQTLLASKAELKLFQSDYDISLSLKKILKSIDAVELSPYSIFSFLEENSSLEDITNSDEFDSELKNRNLKSSELFDTNNIDSLAKLRFKYIWIYSLDSGNLDMPLYILLQYYSPKNQDWSNLKMYYVQKDIVNFYTELSSVTMTIKRIKDGKSWTYKSNTGGRNWYLTDKTLATSTFKNNLRLDEVEQFIDNSDIEVTFD